MRLSKLRKNPPPIRLLESALRDRPGGLSSEVELDASVKDGEVIFSIYFVERFFDRALTEVKAQHHAGPHPEVNYEEKL